MAEKISYISTNRTSPFVSFPKALMMGQAPDKGLYMPDSIPFFSSDRIQTMKSMSYSDVAFVVTNEILKNDIPRTKLIDITTDSYNFEVPLENVSGDRYVMRLDQGPTASFKDFAARMMARLMSYCIESGIGVGKNGKIVILTATSGDTGSAVANAFYGLDGIDVNILFPEGEVTDRQRKQMTTLGGNIYPVAVDGKFDDCQAMVKRAFADPDLEYKNLTSANSINIGRVIPQTVYYFYAHSRLCGKNDKIVYAVPSGNFGNLTGGLIAKRMGVPVDKFVAAVNENDEISLFFDSGEYEKVVPSRKCISNAMNVGHPSNFARIVNLYGGEMDETGKIKRMPSIKWMKDDIFPVSISDDRTRGTIQEAWYNYKLLLEPHGAVGWAGLEAYSFDHPIDGVSVSVETAHPAKFPEEISRLLSFEPPLPVSMEGLDAKKENFGKLPADYDQFKEFIMDSL